jgi:glycogen synthase
MLRHGQIEPDTPLFGFIGRLEEQKGVDILLEALPKILEGGKPIQLVVLGTGKKVASTRGSTLLSESAAQHTFRLCLPCAAAVVS